jgi:hypothetical protein
MEHIICEQSIDLGNMLNHSTNQTYSLTLNSYVTFCDLHHLALDPMVDILSLYVAFRCAHINPCLVDNYLFGISNLLEECYPYVRANRHSCLVSCTLKGAKHHSNLTQTPSFLH